MKVLRTILGHLSLVSQMARLKYNGGGAPLVRAEVIPDGPLPVAAPRSFTMAPATLERQHV
jgi:hypothetical protein